jgi:hypothetical protein
MGRFTARRGCERTTGVNPWAVVRGMVMVLCCALLLAGMAAAQSADSATVLGTVKDGQGGVLPGVTVTAKNIETGLTRLEVTIENGVYQIRALPPGKYEFTVELTGFQTTMRKGVVLTIGAEATIDFTMPIGGVSETVIVEANAPIVDTSSSTVGANLDRSQLESLPTISRDFTDFLRVVAGTASTSEGISFMGARAESNSWQIDGTTNNEEASGAQASSPQIDAIAEFQVLTNNFKAEYGNAAGGVVNAITRSGTNTIHGSLFTYFRNEKFRSYSALEDESVDKAPFKRLYTGGTFGAPIIKNKAFFFGAYERLGEDENVSETWTLPAANSSWNAKMLTFFNTYGIDTALFGAGGTQYFTAAQPTVTHKGSARADYNFGSGQTFTTRYNLNLSKTTTDETGTLFDLNSFSGESHSHDVTLNHKWALSGTKLNEVFVLINHNDFEYRNDKDMPLLNMSSAGFIMGGSTNYPQSGNAWRLQVKEHFTWSFGATHQMKAGAEFRSLRNTANVQNLYKGMYIFPANMFLTMGFPVLLVQQVGNPEIPLNDTAFSGFLQDDWHPTKSLTVSLGVRYDFQNAKIDKISDTPLVYPGGILPSQGAEDPGISRDKNNFAPRIGFTWAPDSRQAVYGGTGIYYDQVILNNFVSAYFTPPYRTIYRLSMPTFPAATTNFTNADLSSTSIGYLDENFRAPYNWNSTLGYRRELTPSLGVDMSVTYNRGDDQQMKINANPYVVGTADIYGSGGTRVYPTVGAANHYFNGGKSRYKAFRLELKQRMHNHVSGGVAYTLSQGKDNSTTKISDVQYPADPGLNYGEGTYDARHRLTAHVETELPYGFQFATIAEFRTEMPLNIIAGGYDLNGDGITDDWMNEELCVNVACSGYSYSRNSTRQISTTEANNLRAILGLDPIDAFKDNPKYFNIDASLRKSFTYKNHSLTFSAEAFNLFNFDQYERPDQSIGSDTFGQYIGVYQPRTFQLGIHYRF